MLCLLAMLTSVRVLTSEEKERERTVSSETWIKDERGDERKNTPKRVCVCCGKALNLLGMRTALVLDCEDR